MTRLTAIYRTSRNGNLKSMSTNDMTKGELVKQLRANGFRVLVVLTDSEIEATKSLKAYELDTEWKEYANQVL